MKVTLKPRFKGVAELACRRHVLTTLSLTFRDYKAQPFLVHTLRCLSLKYLLVLDFPQFDTARIACEQRFLAWLL